jgi:LuxR family transcriptional regulator, maltose regulon positive regulatory protein
VRRIDADLPAVDAEARVRRSRKLRVLKSMALWKLRQYDNAADVMRDILVEGSREGYVRLVIDDGAYVAGPIHAVLAPLKAAPEKSDPILAEYAQRLLDALGPDGLAVEAAQSAAPTDVPWQVEPLTQKELQVLKLLAEGYSNSAMSEKLFVSDSTVRTHLRNINMKLVAQNRTQAVSLARRYGLIR